MFFMVSTHPFSVLESGILLGMGVSVISPQWKPWNQSQAAFPRRTHCTYVDVLLLQRESERAVCDPSQEEEGIGRLHMDFSRLCLLCFTPFWSGCVSLLCFSNKSELWIWEYDAEICESFQQTTKCVSGPVGPWDRKPVGEWRALDKWDKGEWRGPSVDKSGS